MLSPELQQYVLHGQEETNIEYKDSMRWSDRDTQCKIVRAVLALSNHKDGGVIVIGVKQEGALFRLTGMNKRDFDSFNDEDIRDIVGNHSDPIARFTLVKGTMPIKNLTNNNIQDKRFCIIQVAESRELPTCAKRDLTFSNSGICLRKGAVYIRPERSLASREIESQEEWRELLYRCIGKIRERATELFVEPRPIIRVPQPSPAKKRVDDEKKFVEGLKKDKML